jgi:hypothetical protein
MIESLIVSFVVSLAVSFFTLRYARTPPVGERKLIADAHGIPRVELIAEPPGVWPDQLVGLRFLTKSGKLTVGLGAFEDEGTLAFQDATGLIRLGVRMEEGNPRIVFYNHRNPPATGGTRRIEIGLRKDGKHCLEFFNDAGECRLSLGVGDDGTAFISMLDNDGKEIWKVPN